MTLAIGKQLTAEQRLRKATTDIIGHPDFVALTGVLMVGSKKIDDKVQTACTNGRDEIYGRKFVDGLSDAEFRFVVLHECYHKMYKHLTTWQHLHKINAQRANMACDFVINLKLAETTAGKGGWIKLPNGGLIDTKYHGMDSQQVFNLLEDEGDEGGGGGGGGYNPFDDHDWDGASELSEDEVKELAQQLDQAIRQGAILASKVGSGGDRNFGDLLQTKQDWREILRDFVTTTCAGKDYSTWKRPSRRYIGMDILMPSSISESVGEIVVAIDTSGSIGNDELNSFLAEIVGICDQVKPSKVRLLYWDTQVCSEEVYLDSEYANLVQSTKPKGGGGTEPSCVPEYLNANNIKPEAVVMLTDGYVGSWGTWSVPVMWCILNNRSASPTVGKAVHI